jgi:hypothetical protein
MDEKYNGPERREHPQLTEEQIDIIAERAAEVALNKVYTQVGKSVVSKLLWLIGSAALAAFMYFKGAK